MTSYPEGVEDGLLLAALLLEHDPNLRTPEGHFALTALRNASERLRIQRLRPFAQPLATLFPAPITR